MLALSACHSGREQAAGSPRRRRSAIWKSEFESGVERGEARGRRGPCMMKLKSDPSECIGASHGSMAGQAGTPAGVKNCAVGSEAGAFHTHESGCLSIF